MGSVEDGDLSQELRAPSGVAKLVLTFLLHHAKQELLSVLKAPDPDAVYPVALDFLQLANQSPEAADQLVSGPSDLLRVLNNALVTAQHKLLSSSSESTTLSIKEAVRARLTGLTCFLDGRLGPGIGQIRAAHLGRLVVVTGTVIRTGSVQVLEAVRQYECSRCGHRFSVEADLMAGATVQLPTACPSNKARPCKSTNFRHLNELQQHTDFQEIRVQEKSQSLDMQAAPQSMAVIVQDDLVDACQPGDDALITAVVSQQWQSCCVGARCDVSLILHANNLVPDSSKAAAIEVSEEAASVFNAFWEEHREDRLNGRNKILGRFCPQIHGMLTVKLATVLMLIGGLQRTSESGTRIRGEIHMLLIGDPGTGKSQFLKYAARMSPRSVVTSGRGSSAAGLTATAVKDGMQWGLEAGAMVLADGGICCIDEFDGLKDGARAAIHEAMEQQTVSVAKAGMLTTLNSRTTVFGVANPRGSYDPQQSLTANTSLSGPLLSRFDILLVLRDLKIPTWDETVADHVLAGPAGDAASSESALDWDLRQLQQYICWTKSFQPQMTPEAEAVLLSYYQIQRQSPTSEPARTTVRMLESLIRLSQAHARLLAREEVWQQDAVVAVMLVDASMAHSALLSANPMLDTGADGGFQEAERLLLELMHRRLEQHH